MERAAERVAPGWCPGPVNTDRTAEAGADSADVPPASVEPDQATTDADAARPPRWPWQWRRRTLVLVTAAVLLGIAATIGPAAWVYWASAGHRNPRPTPSAPVGIIFGAQLRPDQKTPKPYLAHRLEVGVALVKDGRVRALLVSGDANGTSGNEVAAMTRYLVAHGVPADKIVADPAGLDTYDTCARAAQVYGVKKALLISQDFHLPRAVAICRQLGIDADGIGAPAGGSLRILMRNRFREILADVKAAVDVVRKRPPAVSSGPSAALERAEAS